MPSSLKNFLLTFGISMLVFGFAAYFAVGYIMDVTAAGVDAPGQTGEVTTDHGETTAPSSDDPAVDIKGDSFNVLLIGTDFRAEKFDDYDPRLWLWSDGRYEMPEISQETEKQRQGFFRYREPCADSMVLLRVDKERRSFTYTYIPGCMRLADNGNISLGSFYAMRTAHAEENAENENKADGIDFLLRKVEAVTGLDIDYYVCMGVDAIADVVDAIGGVSFEVPCDMSYEDPKAEFVINLKKGTYKIYGSTAAQLLRFNGYSSSQSANRGNVTLKFIKAMFERATSAYAIANIPTLYDKIVGSVETNLTKNFLIDNAELIFSYKDFTVCDIAYPGAYATDDDGNQIFLPEIKNAIDLFYNYRMPIKNDKETN